MSTQNDILEAALNELRKRREQLDRTIEALEAELGVSSSNSVSSVSADVKSLNGKDVEPNDLLKRVYQGQFFGKSQTQAAKDLLNMVRKPLRTPLICEALGKTGMKVHAPSLYTAFKRSPDFVLVLPNTWGVKEWYPEGVKSIKPGKKSERRERKRKISKPATEKGEAKSSKSTDS
jgi:hypothetical protein